MRNNRALALMATIALLTGLVFGCSNPGSEPEAGEGTMQVFLIDAPGGWDEVNIEVIEVQVHRADTDSPSGWYTIDDDTTQVNLLVLTNGNYAVLADSTLPAGHYTQVRLILSDSNTVVIDGEVHNLDISSSSQSGLKLNHPFDISDGEIYSVTLDFDADRSVHQTGDGQYMLNPVIRLVVNSLSGSVSGVVEPVEARAQVMALANEDTVITHADTLNGNFSFPMLTAGSYDLEFSATVGSFRDTTLADVLVTAGQHNNLGTIVLDAE